MTTATSTKRIGKRAMSPQTEQAFFGSCDSVDFSMLSVFAGAPSVDLRSIDTKGSLLSKCNMARGVSDDFVKKVLASKDSMFGSTEFPLNFNSKDSVFGSMESVLAFNSVDSAVRAQDRAMESKMPGIYQSKEWIRDLIAEHKEISYPDVFGTVEEETSSDVSSKGMDMYTTILANPMEARPVLEMPSAAAKATAELPKK